MIALVLRLLGALMFLATLGLLAASAVLAAYALGSGRVWMLRWIGGGLAAWLLIYGVALAVGPLVMRCRILPPGDELAVCGFDCHLHVSVVRVRVDTSLVVTFRLRSDAKREAEYPSHLRVRLVDAAGEAYPPLGGGFSGRLPAGATVTRDLSFALPAGRAAAWLAITWGDWPDYLVPGPENALVQRRRMLRLPAPTASTAPAQSP